MKTCQTCQKTFYITIKSQSNANKFCSYECYWKSKKGQPSKFKKEIITFCLFCKKAIVTCPSRIKDGRGRYCSKTCSGKQQAERLRKFPHYFGEKSANWQGGVTPINKKIRSSRDYILWRTAVFMRDNYTCVWCGVKGNHGAYLEADHIKPFSLYPELRLAIDNGRTLCHECHSTTDTYKGRAKRFIERRVGS